ncbi:hypothetical protein Sjap_011091 [Stephania japonica]|uniref:Uncharacterized protein n=1 Tax=Stephania japonica TaxID=461633 RepID=A0AAP0JAQ5_9MAGN
MYTRVLAQATEVTTPIPLKLGLACLKPTLTAESTSVSHAWDTGGSYVAGYGSTLAPVVGLRIWGRYMARTKKTEEPKKTKEDNKKTADKGERIGSRAQIGSYRKSKKLGRAMGDSRNVEIAAVGGVAGRTAALGGCQGPC